MGSIGEDEVQANGHLSEHESAPNGPQSKRKRVVVVGLGMVGIAFIEKLLKLDAKRQEYEIIVIGEEPHLAYNRVGLTSFFQHRQIEELYLNPESWYSSMPEGSLNYHLNTLVTKINTEDKTVETSIGDIVSYDTLVLATGSDAILPSHTPGHDANGVFVYRTIEDLQNLIGFAAENKGTTGTVVGGGLLGLEAAKALMDLEEFGKVKLIERNKWVMSRQLDGDAGGMLVKQVSDLGLEVMLSKRVARINTDERNNVKGITFEDGDEIECTCVCFAIGIKARDKMARESGLKCSEKGSGIVVNDDLSTSAKDVYAIGECASWENQTFGLIAPGTEMADVLAFNLTQAKAHSYRKFKRPDLSTKLKLLGVEVASFGDYFADRDEPKHLSARQVKSQANGNTNGEKTSGVLPLSYKDPFQQVYKKYLFTADGKYLLGGMMIGDTKDYMKLLAIVKGQKPIEVSPGEFIVGSSKEEDVDGLPDDMQVCSCHNVTKGDIAGVIKEGTCKSIGEIKSCTKAGTGCSGCIPTVTTIFNKTMEAMGEEVKNYICPHFEYSRADLFNIVYVKKYQSLQEIMKNCGRDPESHGCEVCKPAVASILASLFNHHIIDSDRRGLQDTNDKFLANIQRNGTYSVIPRVPGGEITPDKLVVIGTVAKKYDLYTKITGGQRIDMFGARKQDLPQIWKELIDGGMESGHAYAKALRTVKSCVGTTWCRYGIGDSVGMAVRLEERYKAIRSPHKLKGGVSGCVRECAEAQSKDFGLIATDKGFNIFVGGNGGAKPRHTDLLAQDVPPDNVVPILDRYLAFYIRTADKLQRTARWIENLPGGIKYLKEVILDDKLGIAADLEKQMEELVGSFFCEWTETLNSPERMKMFNQFANTDEKVDPVDKVEDRGQRRPTFWPNESVTEDFKGTKWSTLTWQPLAKCDQFNDSQAGSSVAVKRGDTQLAIFKVAGKYFASQQMCPHKRAFALSDGLIGDDSSKDQLWVSCPVHKRNFELKGENAGNCLTDSSMNIATFPVEAREDGLVYVKLPPVEELDSVLGTTKWRLSKEGEENPFEAMDKKLKPQMKGRKGLQTSHLPNGLGAPGKAQAILAGGEKGSSWMDW